MGCDSPLDLRIKGALVSDLFTLIGVVPLERRKLFESGVKPSLYAAKIVGKELDRAKQVKLQPG